MLNNSQFVLIRILINYLDEIHESPRYSESLIRANRVRAADRIMIIIRWIIRERRFDRRLHTRPNSDENAALIKWHQLM